MKIIFLNSISHPGPYSIVFVVSFFSSVPKLNLMRFALKFLNH